MQIGNEKKKEENNSQNHMVWLSMNIRYENALEIVDDGDDDDDIVLM